MFAQNHTGFLSFCKLSGVRLCTIFGVLIEYGPTHGTHGRDQKARVGSVPFVATAFGEEPSIAAGRGGRVNAVLDRPMMGSAISSVRFDDTGAEKTSRSRPANRCSRCPSSIAGDVPFCWMCTIAVTARNENAACRTLGSGWVFAAQTGFARKTGSAADPDPGSGNCFSNTGRRWG